MDEQSKAFADSHHRSIRMFVDKLNDGNEQSANVQTTNSFPYAMFLTILCSLALVLIIIGLAINRYYIYYKRRQNQSTDTSYSISRYWHRQYPSTSFDSLNISPPSSSTATTIHNQQEYNESSRILKNSFSWPEATLLQQQKSNADDRHESSSTISSSSLSNSSTMEHLCPTASLTFSLRYDEQIDSLYVRILNAKNLYIPRRNRSNSLIDSYVRIELLSQEATSMSQELLQSMRTHIMKKNSHPNYDELFQFSNLHHNPSNLILLFTILTYDTFTRDEILGQIQFPIQLNDVNKSTEITYTKEITARSKQLLTQQLGQMLISLCYQPIDKTITLIILKASNLPRINTTRLINPYFKIYMFYKGQRILKKRSTIKRTTQCPVYNECFVFPIPDNDLEHVYFDIILFDYDRHMKHEVIGTIRIGQNSNENLQHWNDVCRRQITKQIAQWYQLKAFNQLDY